jgi:hypothetical protein
MSITYCSIYSKKEKVLLAESTSNDSFHNRVKNLFSSIVSDKEILNFREIEGNYLVTSLKTKKVIFVCVSKEPYEKNRPKRFMESFAGMVIKIFGNVDSIVPESGCSHLCLQSNLSLNFNQHIESYDTGVYKDRNVINEMNKDLSDIKHDLSQNIKKLMANSDDLDQMLLVSKKISSNAVEYREEAKVLEMETRCFKPWMGILLIILLVLLMVYVIFSLYLCGSLTVFCERKKIVKSFYNI